MKQSAVSIIVVNFDGLEHLATLFASLHSLRYPQELIEIVFVDNGSDDGSVGWVKEKYPHVRIIENERNEGFAAGCNKGASNATADWLAFVNNDMRLDPDWLANMFEAIGECQEKTVCAGSRILTWDGSRIDFTGGVLAFYGHSFQKNFDESVQDVTMSDRPGRTLFACGGAMLIRREPFLEVGGFDDDYFAYFEDVDLGWRLLVLGYEVIFVPSAVAFHKRFGTTKRYSSATHLFLCERNALFTIYKNYSDENLGKILPAALILLIYRALLHADTTALDFQALFAGGSTEQKSLDAPPRESGLLKALKILSEAGIKKTIERARLSLAIRRLRKSGVRPISEEGLTILSALTRMIANLDNLNRRRESIQTNRKKSDSEIFSLFGEPFKPLPETPEFQNLIKIISENFDIDKMFRA